MSLAPAAAFLFSRSLKNRVLKHLQRLRQPRYLIATAVGAFYLYALFARRLFEVRVAPLDEPAALLLEVSLVALALLSLLGAWVVGMSSWAVAFTEAEVHFLFPGPVSRRALLHFRVAKTLLRTTFSAAVMTLVSGTLLGASGLWAFFGLWLALGTLSLHTTGAALVQFRWTARGGYRWPTRLLVGLGILAVLWGSVQLALIEVPLPARWTPQTLAVWAQGLLATPPLGWLLWPLRAPVQLALARELPTFLAALPAALALFAAHYAWVITRDAAFEEAALEGSEQRREWRNLASPTRVLPGAREKRPYFALGGAGRPEVALLWKNLVGMRRLGTARGMAGLLALILFAVVAALVTSRAQGDTGVWTFAAVICAFTAGMITLFGATSVRGDFRQDLQHLDVLRATPLAGWQLVAGQLAAPLLLLVLFQWVALALAVACATLAPEGALPRAYVLPGAVGAALVGPGLVGGGLLIQNGIALLFPEWASVDPQERGLDVLGQRVLAFLGSWLVLIVGVLPAAVVGLGAAAAVWAVAPSAWALAAGGLFAALALAVELAMGVMLLGGLVDKLDPSG